MVTTAPSDFRSDLIQAIKDVGQEIIDRAEDIAGDCDLICSLDIRARFDHDTCGNMLVPYLETSKEYAVRNVIKRWSTPEVNEEE